MRRTTARGHLLIVAAALLLAGGCKSLDLGELSPRTPMTSRLPALRAEADLYSLESAYLPSGGVLYADAGTDEREASEPRIMMPAARDARIQDALTLFEREVQGNITVGGGAPYGYAVFKIGASNIRSRSAALGLLSALTAMVTHTFGLPVNRYRTDLDVEVEILDAREQRVGSYRAVTRGRAAVGLGAYTLEDAQRVSNIRALQSAFASIKEQLEADAPRIRQALEEAGPLVR